ncbi:MAG: arginine--tRNA ligase [Ignavibacteria bacterium]|jgi:arginyl-tRNA synthetase
MKEYLREKILQVLEELGYEGYTPAFEKPKDEKFGDISTNIAMLIAKDKKLNPRETANKIIENLKLSDDYVSKIVTAAPGFINFYTSENYYRKIPADILAKGLCYGKSDLHKGEQANIEWVSANPTGPLHAGHGRHISLGKAVASLLEWSGYKVTREYYFNNAGKQMENLAASVYARYRQLFEPDYKLPDDAYIGEYIISIAQLLKDEYGDELLKKKNGSDIFKSTGEKWCFDSILNTLKRMGITHDILFNEDSLYKDGKIKKILDDFKKNNLSYEKDGAVWLKTSGLIKDRKDAEDKVIVKASGEPTYRLPDMAYHIDKLCRGYDLVLDIFGSDHSDTYKEVLAGVKALGYDTSKIKVIIHQMVTFMHEGKPVKMSKRSDNVYYLDDLLDDVGADVAQFFFVMRSANTHLDFDVDLAKEQSEKNPVFYLQYAHARICGILRNADSMVPGFRSAVVNDFSGLKEPEEIKLCKALSIFPEIVEDAALTFEPHKIITYLNEMAEHFHKFYHNHRVLNIGDDKLTMQRLRLCEASKIVLQNGLNIIGVSAPERM